MNCETMTRNLSDFVSSTLSSTVFADCEQHIARCPDCRNAVHGAEALASLRNRDLRDMPTGLFEEIKTRLVTTPEPGRSGQRFWQGTGFGGAIAASLFALALTFGWIGPPIDEAPDTAEFTVALSEPRNLDIAIEMDRPLQAASISILLSGGIEIDGYGSQRELHWTTDLDAGINRLTLPILAVNPAGGQIVVHLSHPDSERVFVIRIITDA